MRGDVKRRRARVLRWFVVLCALGLVLWSAYWGAMALAWHGGARIAAQQARLSGMAARFEGGAVSGYPARFELGLNDLSIAHEAGGWSTDAIRVSAQSHRPHDLHLDLSRAHRIAGRHGVLDIDAQQAGIKVLFRPEWTLPVGNISMVADAVEIRHAQVGVVSMDRVRANLAQGAAGGAAYEADITIRGLAVSSAFADLPQAYRAIPEMQVRGQLLFEAPWDRGLLARGAPDLVALVVDSAAFDIGPSRVQVTGQLDRGVDGALSGQLEVGVQNWQSLFDLALDQGYVDPELKDFFLAMLGGLAARNGPEDRLILPLRVRNGRVFYGALVLGGLPALR
ncbi:hypothetical protein EV663_10619 [Rhodovulum bhavnagarense]|uniref:DUF2125 domain-containing protein n=1 Tax=Rhodovulum bhavnagarense TaxID=992286 RepID=A0A4R2RE33_9RHOB|nr:DUF2125 domain-containing protein [Rhodovulum bhavnagarense]TCP61073.1 hypothetical protein EV663_10619 [Rhodovulum bhavnagarense]